MPTSAYIGYVVLNGIFVALLFFVTIVLPAIGLFWFIRNKKIKKNIPEDIYQRSLENARKKDEERERWRKHYSGSDGTGETGVKSSESGNDVGNRLQDSGSNYSSKNGRKVRRIIRRRS